MNESRWIPAVLAFALAAETVIAAAAPEAPRTGLSAAQLGRRLDAWAKPLVDRGDLSGQLLVARDGHVLVERSYGWANLELGVRMTPSTILNVASITKPMTTLLAFRLMERRQIAYRDSIARWLPDFPDGDHITIELLLRHRSGIPHELVPDSESVRPRTAAEMVERAKRLPLDFPPGARSSYSSGGFTVLARILELASGKDYGTLLREELLAPLGMTHTLHADAISLVPGRAQDYVPGAHGIENAPMQDFSGLVGAGSVWSTAEDLHRLVQAVVTGRLGEVPRQSFVRGGRLSFDGRTAGFKAYATFDSTSGLEVIWVGNLVTGASDLLRAALPRLAAGEAVPPPSLPTPLATAPAADRLGRYVGSFRLENGVTLVMRVRDGVLWANDWVLLPVGEDTFFSPRDYGSVRGRAGPEGRIETLEWTQNGQVYPAPRIGN